MSGGNVLFSEKSDTSAGHHFHHHHTTMLPNDILDQVRQLRETAETLEALANQQVELDRRIAAAQSRFVQASTPAPLSIQPLIPGFTEEAPDLPDLTPPPPSSIGGSPAGRNVTGSKGGNYRAFVTLALEALGSEVLTGEEVQTLIGGRPGVPTTLGGTHSLLRRMRIAGLLDQPARGHWQVKLSTPQSVTVTV